jgi:hypothetical protein
MESGVNLSIQYSGTPDDIGYELEIVRAVDCSLRNALMRSIKLASIDKRQRHLARRLRANSTVGMPVGVFAHDIILDLARRNCRALAPSRRHAPDPRRNGHGVAVPIRKLTRLGDRRLHARSPKKWHIAATKW